MSNMVSTCFHSLYFTNFQLSLNFIICYSSKANFLNSCDSLIYTYEKRFFFKLRISLEWEQQSLIHKTRNNISLLNYFWQQWIFVSCILYTYIYKICIDSKFPIFNIGKDNDRISILHKNPKQVSFAIFILS